MNFRKNIKKILAVGACVALFGATLTGCTPKITQEDVDSAIAQAVSEQAAKDAQAMQNAVNQAVASVDITADNQAAINAAISDKQAEIDRQAKLLEDYAKAQEEQDAQDAIDNAYRLDELEIGADFSFELTDRQINVFDGEVEFDGDDYEAEEVVYIAGKIASNEEDFNGKTFVSIDKEEISYVMNFEAALDTSLIDEDETLSFSLLGEDVEISEWDVDSVTFSKGVKFDVSEGETISVEGKDLLIRSIAGDKVMIVSGDESEVIEQGETVEINGVEIKVKQVLDDDDATDMAVLEIGREVLVQVEDGDEYAKGSMWEWKIDANSIGVVLVEEFNELDDDLKPLDVGEQICLPNEYACFVYNGLAEESVEKYSLELDTVEGNEYVELTGKVYKGINDYDKVYINKTGIYDEDLVLIDALTVDLDDTDVTLELGGANIIIDDIKISYDLDQIKVDGTDISSFDEDYLTSYGIMIENPEDSVDDNEFSIEVPQEALLAEISVVTK